MTCFVWQQYSAIFTARMSNIIFFSPVGTEPARRRVEQTAESAEGARAGTPAARGTASYARTGPDRTRDQHDDSAADVDAYEADAGETKGQV